MHGFLAVTLFIVTTTVVWFQVTGRFINDWWAQHALLISCLMAIPISLGYYYAWYFALEAFESWWSVRFISFALTFIVFPPLTYFLLGESLFTYKTLGSIFLAIVILCLQAMPD